MIDYQTQQFKLFPLIATAYALIQTGHYMLWMYAHCNAEIGAGKLDSLPEVRLTAVRTLHLNYTFWSVLHTFP